MANESKKQYVIKGKIIGTYESDTVDIDYSCPIPKEWYVKYKFNVMVALTYEDEDIEVEVPLSDKEVDKIKQLIAENNIEEEPEDEEEYVPPTDLLQILEDNDKKLFDKFWWDTIYPRVFIKMLANGIENGYIKKYDDDDFDYNNKDDFFDIQDMYSDDIDLEHSSCCICRIPEEWR